MWRVLNWVFGFGICHIRHINIDNECFRIYFTCRNNSSSSSSSHPQLTSSHRTAPHCTLYSPRWRRAVCFVLLTVIFIISTFLSALCACASVLVCVSMSTITYMPTRQLLAKYTQLQLTVCVSVCVCETNNLNKYFVHCHLGYSVLFVVIVIVFLVYT